jgi:hypothetical protein
MNKSEEGKSRQIIRRARKVSAFALAGESHSIAAEIDVSDVLHLRPSWTPAQAAAFLRNYAEVIGTAMAVSGSEMLIALLREDRHVN